MRSRTSPTFEFYWGLWHWLASIGKHEQSLGVSAPGCETWGWRGQACEKLAWCCETLAEEWHQLVPCIKWIVMSVFSLARNVIWGALLGRILHVFLNSSDCWSWNHQLQDRSDVSAVQNQELPWDLTTKSERCPANHSEFCCRTLNSPNFGTRLKWFLRRGNQQIDAWWPFCKSRWQFLSDFPSHNFQLSHWWLMIIFHLPTTFLGSRNVHFRDT